MSKSSILPLKELFDFLSINEFDDRVVKKLNRYIKKMELKVHFKNEQLFHLKILPDKNNSEVAFEITSPVEVKKILSAKIYNKLQKDFSHKDELFLCFSEIEYSGTKLYVAGETNSLYQSQARLPQGLSLTPVFANEELLKPFFAPGACERHEKEFYIYAEDFDKFKFNFQLDQAKRKPARRELYLKAFLEREGYDTSKKLLPSQHRFPDRVTLWEELCDFVSDPDLFLVSRTTIMDQMFKNNPYISFDRSEKNKDR